MSKTVIRKEFVEAIYKDPDLLDDAISKAEFELQERRKEETTAFGKECHDARLLANGLKSDVDSLEYAFSVTVLQDWIERYDI